MIRVLLDTNIYRADSRRTGPAFRALALLTRYSQVTVCVPDIIRQEYLAGIGEQFDKDILEVRASLKKLLKNPISDTGRADINAFVEKFGALAASHGQVLAAEFDNWATGCACLNLPIGDQHGRRVFESYFGRSALFEKGRIREHLPDAFILAQLVDLVAIHGRVHFVSEDEYLRSAAARQNGVVTHKCLHDFIKSETIKPLLLTARQTSNLVMVLNVLRETLSQRSSEVTDLLELELNYEFVGAVGESGHALISELDEDSFELNLNFNDAYYTPGTNVFVPFNGSASAELNYELSKHDHNVLPDDVTREMTVSERDSHYYDVIEQKTITFEGEIAIDVGGPEFARMELNLESATQLIRDTDLSLDYFVVHPMCKDPFSKWWPDDRNCWWPFSSKYPFAD